MINRRNFLKAGAVGGAGLLASCVAGRRIAALKPTDRGSSLAKFAEPLATPRVLRPTPNEVLDIAMTEVRQKLHRDLDPTPLWGYNGIYPGPTLEVIKNQRVAIRWANRLPPKHLLENDRCLHGAKSENQHGAPPRAVVHLHGARVPPESDGYPEATVLPGQAATYDYPNIQNSTTLWYHDHALGITRLNVYLGLAGVYLIRDAAETMLNLPSGAYEIPLVIQDRSFKSDASLHYPEEWEEEVFGDAILVNGKVWPYLSVEPRKYRFRILNGSNSRTYTLALDSGQPFYQIGTDGGFLAEPVEIAKLTLTSGERADVIVDFSKRRGELHLINSAPAPFPGPPGQGVIRAVLQFRVSGATGDDSALPSKLEQSVRLREEAAVKFRTFNLDMHEENPRCTEAGFRWLINALGWDDDITEYPEIGTTEVWNFFNLSQEVHPIHLHLVQFQILDRQPLMPDPGREGFFLPKAVPGSKAEPAQPNEAGWKDTFRSMPGEATRIITRFEGFTGKYPYHCHILEHEDYDMMRPFEVIARK